MALCGLSGATTTTSPLPRQSKRKKQQKIPSTNQTSSTSSIPSAISSFTSINTTSCSGRCAHPPSSWAPRATSKPACSTWILRTGTALIIVFSHALTRSASITYHRSSWFLWRKWSMRLSSTSIRARSSHWGWWCWSWSVWIGRGSTIMRNMVRWWSIKLCSAWRYIKGNTRRAS